MVSRIDTLATHRAFKEAGIAPAHAEVIVEAINRADDRLATKDDLALVQSELSGEIATLRTELSGRIELVHTELSGQIESVRTELSGQIESVRTELSGSIGIEVGSARTDFGREIAALRAEMNDRFAAVGDRIGGLEGEVAALRSQGAVMKWVMGMNLAATVAIFIRLFSLS